MNVRNTCLLAVCLLLCSCGPRGPMSTSDMRFLCNTTEEYQCGPADQYAICNAASNAVENGNFTTAEACVAACNRAIGQTAREQGITSCSYFQNGAESACSMYCRRNYP